MNMENQYKTEGELYLLFNFLKRPAGHAENLLIHLTPINWDQERIIRQLVSLGKEFGFQFSNFQFDEMLFEVTAPKTYKRIKKIDYRQQGE